MNGTEPKQLSDFAKKVEEIHRTERIPRAAAAKRLRKAEAAKPKDKAK